MTKNGWALWSPIVALVAFLAWMAFTGTPSNQEFLLGAGCAIFSASVSVLTWHAMKISVSLNPGDFLQIVRVPGNVFADAGIVLAVLAKDFAGKRAGSYFRAVPYEKRNGPRVILRRVLAVAYSTVSPNFLAIGIDEKKGWMLFHQIKHGPISELTRKLGARG